MPTIYEARCLNCGNLGHYRDECPRTECRKCHSLGHTGSVCHVKLPPIIMDGTWITDDKAPVKKGMQACEEGQDDLGDDHLEKYYAS